MVDLSTSGKAADHQDFFFLVLSKVEAAVPSGRSRVITSIRLLTLKLRHSAWQSSLQPRCTKCVAPRQGIGWCRVCLTLKRTTRLFGARNHRELLASALRQRPTVNLDRQHQVTAMIATRGSALFTTQSKSRNHLSSVKGTRYLWCTVLGRSTLPLSLDHTCP